MKAGDKAAADLAPADLRGLLKAEAIRSAVARHRFGAVSRFLDWCMDEGHARLNVCAQIGKAKRPKAPAARNRFLTPAQVAVLWKAAERMALPVHRDFTRFLLAVPCRRNEAARTDWAHLDLAAGIWAQPDKLTKNGDPHRFHLPALALDILRERHGAAGEPSAGLVFPAPTTPGAREGVADHAVPQARAERLDLHALSGEGGVDGGGLGLKRIPRGDVVVRAQHDVGELRRGVAPRDALDEPA
ncbi:hypothetical protein J4558_25830 [Leptolyngbya sp. 15MV]|nr:hypothetical protein J4558_25830 [Leptolyngbya sp. 15MV]